MVRRNRGTGVAASLVMASLVLGIAETSFGMVRAGRAEQLADLAGVSLGPPRTISESRGGGPIPFLGDTGGFRLEAQAATPISPGETEITLTVFVVYGIE